MSAFRGANAKVGALGKFLEATRIGRVLRGSVLIIESIDRLSQNKVGEALQLFISILGKGDPAMPDLTELSEPRLMLDLITGALQVRDLRLNGLAAEVLTRFGERSVQRLSLVATNTKNKPDHRVRALEVLARIGPPHGAEVMELSLFLRARNQSVRAVARKIFGCAALAGVPSANVGSVLRK